MTLGSLLGTMPDQGRLLGWRPATHSPTAISCWASKIPQAAGAIDRSGALRPLRRPAEQPPSHAGLARANTRLGSLSQW